MTTNDLMRQAAQQEQCKASLRFASKEMPPPRVPMSRVNKTGLLCCLFGLLLISAMAPARQDETLPTGNPSVITFHREHPDYSRCSACHSGNGMMILQPLLEMSKTGTGK